MVESTDTTWLDALVGDEYDFYGVDNHTFKLGDSVFEALENEEDDYRSYLQSIELKDPQGLIFFQTPIARVRVESTYRGYELIDVTDGHVWLEVGTEDYGDDLYPMFVFRYEPKEL